MSAQNDSRAVMTLDAGGTNFVFSAMLGNRSVVEPFVLPAHADNLEQSLASITGGFRRVQESLSTPPAAISFAFPGPCDYFSGIVIDPGNLPAYRDVPLTAILEDTSDCPPSSITMVTSSRTAKPPRAFSRTSTGCSQTPAVPNDFAIFWASRWAPASEAAWCATDN